MLTILLLLISNVFMTFAWYGHLKHPRSALWAAVLVSWGIAFFEYCFQVPANRFGSQRFDGPFNTGQLKFIQEVLTILVFCGFSIMYLKEPLRWNYLAAFACILAAGFFVFFFGAGPRT